MCPGEECDWRTAVCLLVLRCAQLKLAGRKFRPSGRILWLDRRKLLLAHALEQNRNPAVTSSWLLAPKPPGFRFSISQLPNCAIANFSDSRVSRSFAAKSSSAIICANLWRNYCDCVAGCGLKSVFSL